MVPSFPPREEVVLAPINSPSGTQQHMQKEGGGDGYPQLHNHWFTANITTHE